MILQFAMDKNRKSIVDEFSKVMLERDAKVLEYLMEEGYFAKRNEKFS